MFLLIHFLSDHQYLGGLGARDDHHAVSVRSHNVARVHRHAIACYRGIRTHETIMIDQRGWHNPKRKHWEPKLLQIADVSNAAINHGARKVPRSHGRSHKASHTRDVRAVLDYHHPYGVWLAVVNRGKHSLNCIRIVVLFLFHLHGQGKAYELELKMGRMRCDI